MAITAFVFWICYIGGTLAAVVNPVAGIGLYILVYHLYPESQWWGASIRAIGLRTSFTVALATGVGMIVRKPRLENGARQFPLPFIFALVFGAIALMSLVWGVAVTSRGEYLAEKYIKLMIFMFIMVRCVRTPLHYHVVLLAWLIGVAYLGYQVSGGAGHMRGGRLTGGIGGPDFAESSGLAVHLVATLPLIGAAFFMYRSWFGRLFVLVTGAMAVNALVATKARNAIVGLAVVAASTVIALPRGYRLKGIAAVVVGTVLAVFLTDSTWWDRMETIREYEQDTSASMRLKLWKGAMVMSYEHPLGIGLGNFHHKIREYVPGLELTRAAHNTFVTCVTEMGWAGLACFLGVVVTSVWHLTHLRKIANGLPAFTDIQVYRWRSRFHLGWHSLALRSAILGYLASGFFTTRLFSEDLWLLVGMAMCLRHAAMYMQADALDPVLDSADDFPARRAVPTPALSGAFGRGP